MIGTIVVLAKAPEPGLVKTRLCPPLRHEQAAELAAAALEDTLEAVRAVVGARRVLALHGRLPAPVPGFAVVAQRGDDQAGRIVAALHDAEQLVGAGGPLLLVGTDTPQLQPALMRDALVSAAAGAVALGPAEDGGWWGLAVPRAADAAPIAGVAMSLATTGELTRAALAASGAALVDLPALRDVDTIADALAVSAAAPDTRFARRLQTMMVVS